MKKAHLLYVEDDESLGFVTKDNLEMAGYAVTHATDGQAAIDLIGEERFDLCLLDVMLPKVDGFDVAREIRKHDTDVPIIFLSAKSLKEDKIEGLTIGGDDYITKPFSIEELLLKIDVFLRRNRITGPVEDPSQYYFGEFQLDHANLQLIYGENKRQLTRREADLMQMFAESPNRVLERSHILKELWGEDDYFLGRSLDVFISRLRKYLRSDEQLQIENIHGVGFRFNVPSAG